MAEWKDIEVFDAELGTLSPRQKLRELLRLEDNEAAADSALGFYDPGKKCTVYSVQVKEDASPTGNATTTTPGA